MKPSPMTRASFAVITGILLASQVALAAAPATATNPAPVGSAAAAPAPREVLITPSAPAADPSGNTGAVQRGHGYALGAAGIAVIASGGVLATISANQASTAQTRMTSASDAHQPSAWDTANSDYNSAKSGNQLGLGGIGLGSASLLGGGLLVLTDTSPRASTVWVVAPFKTASADGIAAQVVLVTR